MRKPAFCERSVHFVSYYKERIQNSGLKNVVRSILKSFRKQNSSVQLLFFHLYSAILSRQSFHSIYRVTVVQISAFILINLPSISTLLIKKSVAVTAATDCTSQPYRWTQICFLSKWTFPLRLATKPLFPRALYPVVFPAAQPKHRRRFLCAENVYVDYDCSWTSSRLWRRHDRLWMTVWKTSHVVVMREDVARVSKCYAVEQGAFCQASFDVTWNTDVTRWDCFFVSLCVYVCAVAKVPNF